MPHLHSHRRDITGGSTPQILSVRWSQVTVFARRIKAKQDAAREFERSGKVALAGKTQSESLVNIDGDAGKAGRSTSQGKGLALVTSSDRQTPRQAREEAKAVPPNETLDAAGN